MLHTSGSQKKHSSQNTIDNRNVFGPYWYLGLFCICTIWVNSFELYWFWRRKLKFSKKKMVSRSVSRKDLKISRSMSKSEFTEWTFHWRFHHFQVKHACSDCPIWHSIGIWKSHCSKISEWNHVFFSASKAASHLTSHQTFG